MPVDPIVQGFLDQFAAAEGPALEEMQPAEARVAFDPMMELQGPPEDVASIEDRSATGPNGDVPVRIYRASTESPLPVLVFMHGGGWVVGSIAFHDRICRSLTNLLGAAVVSVEYRLAPEHRYPAAAEDSYAALVWVHEHARELGIDPDRIALGGDSAGGNLTAVVSLMARDRGGPPLVYQVMHCPVTDHSFETESYRANAEGYMLSRPGMQWFWDHYVPDVADRDEPYASPLRATDLGGLPPALVQVAQFDPLHDEGVAYAERLRDAGVEVTLTDYSGMIHDLWMFGALFSQARAALEETASHVRAAFDR